MTHIRVNTPTLSRIKLVRGFANRRSLSEAIDFLFDHYYASSPSFRSFCSTNGYSPPESLGDLPDFDELIEEGE